MSHTIIFLGERGQAVVGDSGGSSTKELNYREGKACTVDPTEKTNEFDGMP